MQKEDKRSLKLLWHDGRVAVHERRHFRCVYDIADRVYPETDIASPIEYEDSWLFAGLSGCGIAPERHLVNYFTGPSHKAVERKKVIARNLKQGPDRRGQGEGPSRPVLRHARTPRGHR